MEPLCSSVFQASNIETHLSFTLKHWCLWQAMEAPAHARWPGGTVLPANGGNADVGFLPMMQRRRLSPLARAACAVAGDCRQESGNMPTVFYSSHGESQYYFAMLEGLVKDENVSPSRFSLCVHNAIAGLNSIHSESFMPYVSLAGGTEGLFSAFLEAAGWLTETAQVLVVCYEQPLPEVYQPYVASAEQVWALGWVLARADEPGLKLRLARRPNAGQEAGDGAQTLVQGILAGLRSGQCRLDRSIWHWNLEDV